MSVIVAFKYKDGIMVGADRRVSRGFRLRDDNVSKIAMTKYSGHVMGGVGMLRHINLLSVKDELMEYPDILDGVEVDMSYVINTIVPNLINYFYGMYSIGAEVEGGIRTMDSQIMYATPNKIFVIGEDFSVMEYPLWCAIGCGEEMVTGLLSNISDEMLLEMDEQQATELMSSCITYACQKDSAISDDFEIIVLEKYEDKSHLKECCENCEPSNDSEFEVGGETNEIVSSKFETKLP